MALFTRETILAATPQEVAAALQQGLLVPYFKKCGWISWHRIARRIKWRQIDESCLLGKISWWRSKNLCVYRFRVRMTREGDKTRLVTTAEHGPFSRILLFLLYVVGVCMFFIGVVFSLVGHWIIRRQVRAVHSSIDLRLQEWDAQRNDAVEPSKKVVPLPEMPPASVSSQQQTVPMQGGPQIDSTQHTKSASGWPRFAGIGALALLTLLFLLWSFRGIEKRDFAKRDGGALNANAGNSRFDVNGTTPQNPEGGASDNASEAVGGSSESRWDYNLTIKGMSPVFADAEGAAAFIKIRGGLPSLPNWLQELVARQETPKEVLCDTFIKSADRRWITFRMVVGDWRDDQGARVVCVADTQGGKIWPVLPSSVHDDHALMPDCLPVSISSEQIVISSGGRRVSVPIESVNGMSDSSEPTADASNLPRETTHMFSSSLGKGEICIDQDGVRLNGKLLSESLGGKKLTLSNKMRAMLGNPTRVVRSKLGDVSEIWNGISLMPAQEFNLLSIELEGSPESGQWQGSVTVEDVPITKDTPVTIINTLLVTRGREFSKTSSSPSGGSLWDLKYGEFMVRLACDEDEKVRGVIVMPRPD